MGEAKIKNKLFISPKKGPSKSSFTTWVIILSIAGIIGYDYIQRNKTSPLEKFDLKRTKGQVEAPVTILEFMDFQCPECRNGYLVLKEYIEKYPQKIRLSMRYYPLGQLNSTISAVYAQCAARQDKFWELHDIMMERQSEWRTMLKVRSELNGLAKEVGLDEEKLKACVEDDKIKDIVESDKRLGESNFVKSTPTYFINGDIHVGSASLRMKLKELLEGQSDNQL